MSGDTRPPGGVPLLFDAFNRPISRRTALGVMGLTAAAGVASAFAPRAVRAAGGTVTIGNSEGNPEHLDLLLTPAFVTRQNAGPCHGFLVNLNVDGTIGPEIATAWEVIDDTHIKFAIRDGVKFHNGRPLVADDVRKTYEHIMKPETGSTFRASLDPVLDHFEIPDDRTAVAVLKEAFPAFVALASQIPIYPMEVVEAQGDMKTNPVGAGPFRFKEWQKDNFTELVRFEDYWDPDIPKIDTLRILPRSDAAALLAGFTSGEADVLFNYRFTDKPAIEGADGKGFTTSLFGFQFAVMDTSKPPFNDARVRKAMELGLDRTALAMVAQGPDVKPASVLIPQSSPLYPDSYTWQRDVEGAKKLLADAGVAGQEIAVLIVDLPFARPYGPVAQANLEELGLKAKVDIRSVADFIDIVYTQKTGYQLALTGDASPPDPSLFLNRYLTTGGSTNVMNYSNADLDDLLAKAGSVYDEADRAKLYEDAMAIVVDQAPAFPLFENTTTYAMKNHISDFAVKSNADFAVSTMSTSKS
jgi:peptide/nickel transport system substrate-binding protein